MVSWVTLGNGDRRAFLTSADSSPIVLPFDWSDTNYIECVGGGQSGVSATLPGQTTAGGRGGCYARKNNWTGGGSHAVISFQIGSGGVVGTALDTWFVDTGTVLAKGGTINTTASIGDVKFAGGNRGIGDSQAAGGAAGPNGAGESAPDDDFGTGGAGDAGFGGTGGTDAAGGNGTEWDATHGSGGGGGASGNVSFAGGSYGGGGSGIGMSTGAASGGAGAAGLIVITYTPVPVTVSLGVTNSAAPGMARALAAFVTLAAINGALGFLRLASIQLMRLAVSPNPAIRWTGTKMLRTSNPAAAAVTKSGMVPLGSENAAVPIVTKLGQVMLRALNAAAARLSIYFFELPSACNTITVKAQDRTIVIECDPKTYEFPARYTPESMIYGADFTHRLGDGESIVTAVVEMMNGDLTVSNVQTDGRLITFRLSGGTVTYQRIAIRGITDATTANTIQAEAIIACYP